MFEATNHGDAPLRWLRTAPFLDVRLVARTREGIDVPVEEPALDLPVTSVQVTLAAGERAQWGTPIRIAFDVPVDHDDPFTWCVQAPRAAVVLRAHLAVADQRFVCAVEDAASDAPALDVRPAPSPRPTPSPDVLGARLAAILQGPPSSEAWRDLFHLLVAWPTETAGPCPTGGVLPHIAHWPDAIRVVGGHIVHGLEDELARIGPLARVVTIHTRSEAGSTWLWKVAAAPELSGVVALDVTQSEVTAGSLGALLHTTQLTRLTSLDLTLLDWTPPMRQAFAEGPLVARLHHLGVISGHLEDAHVREMFGGRTLPHLQSLDLRHNALSAAGKAWLRAWWQGPPRGLVLD